MRRPARRSRSEHGGERLSDVWPVSLVAPAAALAVFIAAFHYNTDIRPAGGVSTVTDAPASTAPLGLPDRLDYAAWSTPTVANAPAGRAAVMISGSQFPYFGWGDTNAAALIGPGGIRMSERQPFDEWHPGQSVLLSPDGWRTVHKSLLTGGPGENLRVQELVDGQARDVPLPGPPPGYSPHHDWRPFAWMPDSTHVIVSRHSFRNPPGTYKELGLLNITTGAYRQIAITTAEGELHPGFAVAVSPDAQHLAYQASQSLVVVRVSDGVRTMATSLESGALLAGKAAWTPDGTAIAVVVPDQPSAKTPRWRTQLLDAKTGQAVTGAAFPEVSNALVIRAIGWQPSGDLVVVAYRPERRFHPQSLWDRTSFQYTRRVELLGLKSGGSEPKLLLKPPTQHLAIDVADSAIRSGLSFDNPNPPMIYLSRRQTWTITAVAALPLVLILLALRQRRRSRTNDAAAATSS